MEKIVIGETPILRLSVISIKLDDILLLCVYPWPKVDRIYAMLHIRNPIWWKRSKIGIRSRKKKQSQGEKTVCTEECNNEESNIISD